jgi:aminoglycoside/choline kinase family phosphotransferase
VARMHDLGFIHRDLHLRNLVWRREASGPRVLFYDAWRGGARLQSRGISYDVACLTQGLAWEAGEPCADQFLELYLARRGPGVNLARLRSRVAGERKRLQVRQARPWAASPPSVE